MEETQQHRRSTRVNSVSVPLVDKHVLDEVLDDEQAARPSHISRVRLLINKVECSRIPELQPVKAGAELTGHYLLQSGFNRPYIIPSRNYKNGANEARRALGIQFPLHLFTPAGIARTMGDHHLVHTIDVETQDSGPMLTLQDITKYYNKPPESRERLLNIVSLLLAGTPFEDSITPPRAVRELELAGRVWPDHDTPKPATLVYALLGPQGAYTDWHVDMGGSSVWYHVVKGGKTFVLAPPTPDNLKEFERWSDSRKQSEIFLGDRLQGCMRVRVRPGDTLFLPSGWPHAVATPKDSIVVGGNFLHGGDWGMIKTVYDIEQRLGVKPKFQYPLFKRLIWYAALDAYKRLDTLTGSEVRGLQALAQLLREWLQGRKSRDIPMQEMMPYGDPYEFVYALDRDAPLRHTSGEHSSDNTECDRYLMMASEPAQGYKRLTAKKNKPAAEVIGICKVSSEEEEEEEKPLLLSENLGGKEACSPVNVLEQRPKVKEIRTEMKEPVRARIEVAAATADKHRMTMGAIRPVGQKVDHRAKGTKQQEQEMSFAMRIEKLMRELNREKELLQRVHLGHIRLADGGLRVAATINQKEEQLRRVASQWMDKEPVIATNSQRLVEPPSSALVASSSSSSSGEVLVGKGVERPVVPGFTDRKAFPRPEGSMKAHEEPPTHHPHVHSHNHWGRGHEYNHHRDRHSHQHHHHHHHHHQEEERRHHRSHPYYRRTNHPQLLHHPHHTQEGHFQAAGHCQSTQIDENIPIWTFVDPGSGAVEGPCTVGELKELYAKGVLKGCMMVHDADQGLSLNLLSLLSL